MPADPLSIAPGLQLDWNAQLVAAAQGGAPGTAVDSGPNGLAGSVIGAPVMLNSAMGLGTHGVEMPAAAGNTAPNRIEFANAAGVALAGDCTLYAVVDVNGWGTDGLDKSIVSKDANAGSPGAILWHVDASGKLQLDRPYIQGGNSSQASPIGNGIHVLCVTVAGSAVTHYVDNVQVGTDAQAPGTATTQPLRIGAFSNGTLIHPSGTSPIARVAVFNQAHGSTDRTNIYNLLRSANVFSGTVTTANVTPDALTWSVAAGPTRGINQFDTTRFPIRPDDAFATDTTASYWPMVLGGSTTVSIGGGQAVFSGAAAGELALRASAASGGAVLAPYCWAEMTVSGTTGGSQPFVGFGIDANNYAWAYFDGTHVGVDSRVAGSDAANSATVAPVAPYIVRLVLCYPEVWAWLQDANGNRPIAFTTLAGTPDLRKLNEFAAAWQPLFGFNRTAGGGTGTCTQFRAGYTGAIGLRDFKLVVNVDGTPYVDAARPTLRFFLSTCATGNDFKTNHASIISIDTANAFATAVECLLFYDVSAASPTSATATRDTRTSLYGGCVIRDAAAGLWRIYTNGWGLGNVSTGVQLWYAQTAQDITGAAGNAAQRVIVLDAWQRVVKDLSGNVIANGLYDNDLRFDETLGLWVEVCAEANAPSNWTNYAADLLRGPDPTAMVRVAQDAAVQAEGLNWGRIGGKWYATSGGTGGPWYWDTSLNRQGTLAYNLNLAGANMSFSGFGSHFPILPIDAAGGKAEYLAIGFDDSTVGGGNATKGAIVILSSAPQPTGSEFGAPETETIAAAAQTPVSLSLVDGVMVGNLTIVREDVYGDADGRAFLFTAATGANWPANLSGWTITLTATKTAFNVNAGTTTATAAGVVVTASGAGQAFYVALPSSFTTGLALGTLQRGYAFDCVATNGSDRVTLARGLMSVLANVMA
jgi:hypothetical protein